MIRQEFNLSLGKLTNGFPRMLNDIFYHWELGHTYQEKKEQNVFRLSTSKIKNT